MRDTDIKLLDVVALIRDLPKLGLVRGDVGAVVEVLEPEVFEVEFAGADGKTYAQAALPAGDLLLLHFHPKEAA